MYLDKIIILKYNLMKEEFTSNNKQKDEFNMNNEYIDYEYLITKLNEIKTTITLLEKRIFS